MFTENEACFLFLSKGAFNFRTPTNLLSFNEGDGMLSKCGNYFIEQISINNTYKEETITATGAFFYPDMVRRFFETDLSITSFSANFDTNKITVGPLLKSFVESIDYILDNPAIADENLIATKLKELLLLLSKTEKAASIHSFINSLFIPYEYEFRDIIQQHQYTNLSVEELAKLCSMSVATFKRKFNAIFHESPARYILLQKLEQAKHLLQVDGQSIADIAYKCGFESVSGFDKAFKKQYGTSPTIFRMSQKNN